MISWLNKKFPPLSTADAAKQHATTGAIGGLVFSAMFILGIFYMVQALHDLPVDNEAARRAVTNQIIISVVGFAAVLLMSWRVYSTAGYISAILLLTYFIIETGANVAAGSTGPTWVIIYCFIALMLISGIRGSWHFKRGRTGQPYVITDHPDEEPLAVRVFRDIRQRKGWYIKKVLSFCLLSIAVVIFSVILAMLITGSLKPANMQVFLLSSSGVIYLAFSVFSKPLGFRKKLLCWVGALTAYWLLYQLLSFFFIFLPSALESETSMEMLVKTGSNTFGRIGYIDLVATLAGLFIQVKAQHFFARRPPV